MEKFVIKGGEPLSGELTVAGNKNAALPILAACLLTEEELLLHRVPRIRDTEAQVALLERLGVDAEWVSDNSLRLCAASVSEVVVDEELSKKIRASFLLAGPLLARFGEAKMPPPAATSSAAAASTRISTPSRTWERGSRATAGSSWRRSPAACAPARSSWTSRR